MKTADAMSRTVEAKCGPSGLVSWYLMASLLYYNFDRTILSDGRFDEMAKTLLANWADVKHTHKNFITEDDLRGGSLLLKIREYPNSTRSAALTVLRSLGEDLTGDQLGELWAEEFLPPERLRYDGSLYPYSQDGKSWAEIKKLAKEEYEERMSSSKKPAVRRRVRAEGEAPAIEAPVAAVRVRSRPAVAPAPAPEVRVRTRTR